MAIKEHNLMQEKILESVKIDTVPLPDRAVRVSVPASVAYDLKSFEKVQAAVLGKLGCPGCHSGLDIRYDVIRSYYVDDRLNVRETVGEQELVGR
jgi:hypothetical protein